MRTQTFKPSSKYLMKLRVIATLIAGAILIFGLIIGLIIALDRSSSVGSGTIVILVVGALDVLWWAPAMFLVGPYYNSLSYEVQDDEVIMRVGIVTKSVKHVPYRTVTNITIKRGVLDRMFGLGTLNIQTAGMSGTTGAEESLEGLENVQEVYDLVATELRRFRGGMSPTGADVDAEPLPAASDVLNAILAETRAIRESLESDDA